MGDTIPDIANDIGLLKAVARAIAEVASCRTVEPLHRAPARAALAAIEAAGFAILPRPKDPRRRTPGNALSRAQAGPGPSAADLGDDIRAARLWPDRLAAELDRLPEGCVACGGTPERPGTIARQKATAPWPGYRHGRRGMVAGVRSSVQLARWTNAGSRLL
jgi:hypothetical protein